MSDSIHVVIVDDHPLFRQGVSQTLASAPGIVMLTVSEEEDTLLAALRAGARAYVLKGVSGRELIAILRGVMAGEVYITPVLAASLLMEMTGSRTI